MRRLIEVAMYGYYVIAALSILATVLVASQ